MTSIDVVRIEPGQCVACAICADVCPVGALTLSSNELVPVFWPERCTACAACERECPTGAISMNAA